MDDQVKPRRKRGVPLNDLDRRVRWVIAYSGRRWEVIGPAGEPDAPEPARGGQAGASAGGAAPAATLGRHAAPDADRPDGS